MIINMTKNKIPAAKYYASLGVFYWTFSSIICHQELKCALWLDLGLLFAKGNARVRQICSDIMKWYRFIVEFHTMDTILKVWCISTWIWFQKFSRTHLKMASNLSRRANVTPFFITLEYNIEKCIIFYDFI